MKFIEPSSEMAPYGLRAMTMVARAAEGGLGHNQRALLAASQSVVTHTDIDIDKCTPISPEELANHFTGPDLRRQLVQSMVIMSIVNGPATLDQIGLITSFAKTLDIDEPAVKAIQDLAKQEILMFRLDFYRRSHVVDYIKSTYRSQGALGLVKEMLGVKGLVEDKKLAKRFHVFGELPENTLGYAFYHHYVDNGFAFFGEKGGFPMGAVYHDFAHVLSENHIDPEGEILVSAFQAGFRRNENAFFIALFAILIHSTVADMIVHPKNPPIQGRLGQGDLPERMLKELKRGSAMTIDLGADWDFWPYVALPINEVRQKLGIPPKE